MNYESESSEIIPHSETHSNGIWNGISGGIDSGAVGIYKINNSYELTVVATDQEGNSTEQEISIYFDDNHPSFDVNGLTYLNGFLLEGPVGGYLGGLSIVNQGAALSDGLHFGVPEDPMTSTGDFDHDAGQLKIIDVDKDSRIGLDPDPFMNLKSRRMLVTLTILI